MVLKGNIVVLRPLTVDDAEITFRWRHSERARYLQHSAQTPKGQADWIRNQRQTGDLNFIIEFNATAVGMISLLDINDYNRTAVIGRLLLGEKEITGHNPVFFESEFLLYEYAFFKLRLHKIYGEIMEDNITMLRSRLYLGYKQDGVLRDHYIFDGKYKNAIVVSLLEDEYRDICRPKLLKFMGAVLKP